MYILGGYDSGNDKYFSDILFYDFATQKWLNAFVSNQTISPVYNHAAVWDPMFNCITVIGGKGNYYLFFLFHIIFWSIYCIR